MPVEKMLADIEEHGQPIGMVGIAWLKYSKRPGVLRMMFRKDAKSLKTVERSAQEAERRLANYVANAIAEATQRVNVKPDEQK
jgi:hypothetical protein